MFKDLIIETEIKRFCFTKKHLEFKKWLKVILRTAKKTSIILSYLKYTVYLNRVI